MKICKNPKQVIEGIYDLGETKKSVAKKCGIKYDTFIQTMKKEHFSGRAWGEPTRKRIRKGLEKIGLIIDY